VVLDRQLMQAARLWAAQNRPYYASVLFRCPMIESATTPTLAVDRFWRIYVNPTFANRLGVTRLAAILIHEANHLIRHHHSRADSMGVVSEAEHRLWNLAGDAEINDDLLADGLDIDPDEAIFPWTLHQPRDRVAEEYYRGLASEERDRRPSCGSGAGGEALDDELDGSDGQDGAVGTVEARILRRQVAADIVAHAQGHEVPAGLLTWAHELLEPTVDWRRELSGALRAAVVTAGLDDYSYRRFARRNGADHTIRWPGLIHRMPRVAVVVDTSASMSDDDVARAFTEVHGILRSASVADDAIRLVTCDTTVAEDTVITDARRPRRMGRGGTDMRVGITRALAGRPRPDLIVVLTDGDTPWPERRPPGVGVVIVVIADDDPSLRTPDWARTIRVDAR
jgi:predicted metal-dependent peptidase